MAEKDENVYPRKDGPLNHLRVVHQNVKPSWRRFGTGWCETCFETHDNAQWLSIRVSEHGEEPVARKMAYSTLDRKAARALRDMLNKLNLDGE